MSEDKVSLHGAPHFRSWFFWLLSGLACFASDAGTLNGSYLPHISAPLAPPEPSRGAIFQVGEELTYNVSYASIDIGQVRIKLLETITQDRRTIYKAAAYIDSYKGLPIVNLHAVYENQIDQNVYARWFHSRNKSDDQWQEFTYSFEYPNRRIIVERGIWKSATVQGRDTISIDTMYQDGLSLFFLARANVLTAQQMNIPTFVNEKKGSTFINFTGEHTKEEIDAVKYPIDVVHFEGEAGFVGVLGLTGGFEGWFSNDDARVPIVAKMKVLLGNVRIELMSWKRTGWSPPEYHEGSRK